ncbi:hypothetical protein [Streptomyces sp. IBSBF 2435]|uniref:hypothetical protein n=1 Tax=Streptomyces sp. IBSBF 2435 TaxID=2903531 RepID=UPI002FDBDEEC
MAGAARTGPDQRQRPSRYTNRQPTDPHHHQKRQQQIGIHDTREATHDNPLNSKNPPPASLTSPCRTTTDKNPQIITTDQLASLAELGIDWA